MSNHLINNINEADIEYAIVVKRASDIFSELTDDPKELLIYESIIDGIERTASRTVIDGKIAQLPSIGCIRKNPLRKVIKDNHEKFKIARTKLTGFEYKEHVKSVIVDARELQAKDDYDKSIIRKIRSRNKKTYDKYYLTIGKAYAEMYILSIFWLKEVPYVLEVQEHFDNLNGL